ncbi:CPuORF23 - conserved peptide uORF-containing transcript [Musa troglodytarum]|uniref:Trehalose 6-phosphate phosphatase n=1 Tax=Musa troglodytarum TaxID=320322 RepID=A0A9E7FL57_9LILI|nr:CPuORF23 - conserved peptide uORF-containing transcript [Musa troglodytarum]
MDMKSNHSSPVLTDPVPLSKSRLGLPSNITAYSLVAAPYSSSGLYLQIPRRKAGKLDDVRATGWLDAMKSSSPPRKKLMNKDFTSESQPDETDAAYSTWKMRSTVKKVAKYFPTAIISGRSRDKVYGFVRLSELHYAGSHGMDIMGPIRESESVDDHPGCIRTTDEQGKEVHLFQPASDFLPMIDEVYNCLDEITKDIIGVKVESNKFCVSVHYRNVDEKMWEEVGKRVFGFLKGFPRLRVTHGRKVLEVRPVIDWNKGKAVEFLLESLGLSHRDDVLPIYVGDDRTDEDAFKVLRESDRGFGILVSTLPKETNAFYSLRDPSEVLQFLESLVSWKKSQALLQTKYHT